MAVIQSLRFTFPVKKNVLKVQIKQADFILACSDTYRKKKIHSKTMESTLYKVLNLKFTATITEIHQSIIF